jgi:hypothetical protein
VSFAGLQRAERLGLTASVQELLNGTVDVVAVVGEIAGATSRPLGEVDYTYPVLKVQYLKAWEPLVGQPSTFFGNTFWRGAGYSTDPVGVGPSLTIPVSPSK